MMKSRSKQFDRADRDLHRISVCYIILVLIAVIPHGGVTQVSDEITQTARGTSDVEDFIKEYFDIWSSGDMEQYRLMFHENARIMMSINGRIYLSLGRDEFVDMQARELARRSMIEHMTDLKVHVDSRAATATAAWLLDDQGTFTTGIDRFTLIRDEQGNWKIIFLLFYND